MPSIGSSTRCRPPPARSATDATRSTSCARCCTTSATRSARSTTPTSRRRSCKPFVSEQNHWIVDKHAIFQGYYFFEYLGLDRDARERFRDHEWFDATAEFCERYDQCSFDPAYESLPLAAFAPMVQRLFAQPKRSIYRRED